MLSRMKAVFQELYGCTGPIKVFFSPGRVNLIGEHTDYNGGHVLPCALTVGTFAMARKRTDSKIRFYSVNFPEVGVVEITLDDLTYNEHHDWANYPKGMIVELIAAGYEISCGMDWVFGGNIPNGAGVSSSASIELAAGVAMESLYELNLSRMELVTMAQHAENQYIGVQCGIMDQFAVGMGRKDCVLMLNTDTLDYEVISLLLNEHILIVSNTNKRRGLADSQYNQRTRECKEALEALNQVQPLEALCHLSPQTFQAIGDVIENPVAYKRARHVIYENARVLEASQVLKMGDLKRFGELMNASHQSLKEDYEVTGAELDTLVKLAWEQPGVLGSRMTGAGFGGCTVSLVKQDNVPEFIKAVGEGYFEQIGYRADFYVVDVGDGAKEICTIS